MRKLIIAAAAALGVVVLGGGGWFVASRLLHDPVAASRKLIAEGQVPAAMLELRNAVRSRPDDAVAHALLGALMLQTGDILAAEKELKRARELHYAGPELVPNLARTYLAQQRFHDLLHEFAPDAGLPPPQEMLLLVDRSLAELAQRDTVAASASAAAAERLQPDAPEPKLAAARILNVLGERGEALRKLDQALALDPKLLEALGLKADIERERGALDAAQATLDQAVAAAPDLVRVRLARARVLLLRGDDAAARDDIARALKVDPKNSFGQYLNALLKIRAKDWAGADVALQQIQPMLPKVPRGEYYLGLVKANVNQLEQAAEAAGHYAGRNPNDADAFRLLARVDLQLGKKAAAADALRRVDELGGEAAGRAGAAAQARTDTDTSEALTHLAAQQLDAGDSAGAERDLEQSLENIPQQADTSALQVIAALGAADVPTAAAALARLRAEPHADPSVLGNLTGLVQLAQLDFAGARATWEATLKAGSTSATVQLNLVRVLVLQGELDAADALLSRILAAQPGQRAALRAFIEIAVARNQLPRALAAVQAARHGAPSDTSYPALGLLVTQAALDARAGDFGAAYSVLDEVPLEQAQAPLLLTVRAQILLQQGRKQEAADTFRQVLQAVPGDLRLRQQLMQLLVELNHGADAEKLAREGLTLAQGDSALQQTLIGLVFRVEGLDAALAEIATLKRDPVNLPMARLLTGALYAAANRPQEAVAAYQAELKTEPFGALAIACANVLHASGRDAEAVALLHDWVAQQPDPAASNTLAAIAIGAHQYDAAAKELDAVLAVRPNDAQALNNLAWIAQLRHDPKARALAQRAWLLAPSGQTADTLGWILAGEGQTDSAVVLLRRAVTQLPNNPGVAYHLAATLKTAGQRDEARRLASLVVASNLDFDEKAQAQQLLADLGGPPPAETAPPPAPTRALPAATAPVKPGRK